MYEARGIFSIRNGIDGAVNSVIDLATIIGDTRYETSEHGLAERLPGGVCLCGIDNLTVELNYNPQTSWLGISISNKYNPELPEKHIDNVARELTAYLGRWRAVRPGLTGDLIRSVVEIVDYLQSRKNR